MVSPEGVSCSFNWVFSTEDDINIVASLRSIPESHQRGVETTTVLCGRICVKSMSAFPWHVNCLSTNRRSTELSLSAR